VSREATDSWSSRVTGYASQRSSPDCRLRIRRPVAVSKRVAYTSHLPSGDNTGRIALPCALVIVAVSPVWRSNRTICHSGNCTL